MSSGVTVIYDACVLYPAPLRDLLMHLALADIYRACWSEMIHDEWTRNVLASRPDLQPDQLKRTRQLMNSHVRDSLVTGFEYLIPSFNLPDPDDRHVAAAAVHSGASLIVTFNLKDFPAEQLSHHNLAAQHPDNFIADLLNLYPEVVLESVKNHRRSLKNPSKSVDDYLDTLLAQGLNQSVATLRSWSAVI